MSKVIEPTLKKEQVLGEAESDSPKGQEYTANYESAKEALARADAAELFTLYEKAVKDRNEIEGIFRTALAHYVGTQDTPRYQPDDNAIAAMERVALAAIELARSVVLGKEK